MSALTNPTIDAHDSDGSENSKSFSSIFSNISGTHNEGCKIFRCSSCWRIIKLVVFFRGGGYLNSGYHSL